MKILGLAQAKKQSFPLLPKAASLSQLSLKNSCFRPSEPLLPEQNQVVLGVSVVAEPFAKFQDFLRQDFCVKLLRVSAAPASLPRAPTVLNRNHRWVNRSVFLKSLVPDPRETRQAAA